MQLPIIKPAPVVETHAHVFRTFFENQQQYHHFEHYLTGLMVLSNKSMANICRCTLASPDKTNLSRFFKAAPWSEISINDRRVSYMLEQTASRRQTPQRSCLIFDDTLCEHVGSLFEYVDRHYNHADKSYPLAHNVVTSHYVSGIVRFPVDLKMYRRYEEVTHWEEFVHKHFPEVAIPRTAKQRQSVHKKLDPVLLEDPAFEELHNQFKSKITLAQELVRQAIERNLPFKVVLMDSWYLADDLVELLASYYLDWISLIKKNRNLETASFTLRDADGNPIALEGPHIKVENLVPLIPKSAYRKVSVRDREYWCFALNVRVPGLKKVRLIISFDNAALSGTYVVLISNRTDWTAKKIIETYLQRWPIETFYQDSKGHLGLDEYRMRAAEAIQKHWCLVFVAYSILHLECLQASPGEGKQGSPRQQAQRQPSQSIGEVCRKQAQSLIEALILFAHEQLQKGATPAEVFAHLFTKHAPILQAQTLKHNVFHNS